MSDEDIFKDERDKEVLAEIEKRHMLVTAVIPPGLEFLAPLDMLFVKQEIELMEIVCGCETNNHYSVKDGRGREIMRATEVTGCCCRHCCGPARAFTIIVDDFDGHEIVLKRNLACNSCFCCCCLNEVKVYSPSTEFIGRVTQKWTMCGSRFVIRDCEGKGVLRITGPCCKSRCCWCSDINFSIYSVDGGGEIGKISKKWGGFVQEAFTDADNFGISFPKDVDVKIKACLIGAAILLDFMFFERDGNEPGTGGQHL